MTFTLTRSPSPMPHGAPPCGIGEGLRVKVNVNLGTSRDIVDVDEELAKAKVAMRYGADAVMDLSTGGDIDAIRRRIIQETPVPIGTVPIYQEGLGRPAGARWSIWTRTTSSTASRSMPRTVSTS